MNKKVLSWMSAGLILCSLLASCSKKSVLMSDRIPLTQNWLIQRSDSLKLSGSVISGETVDTGIWYKAVVPSTVMGTLVANGLYPNLFMADSLLKVDPAPFAHSWWYRTRFVLPASNKGRQVSLHLDGVSYSANIWLNGKQIASADSIYGTFRTFALDISKQVRDSVNILAIEVFPQKPGDFGLGFVDWNPPAPDKNMGLWRDVYLHISGDVSIEHAWVRTDKITDTPSEASLSVFTTLENHTGNTLTGTLKGKCEAFSFSIPVTLNAGETREIKVDPSDEASLKVKNPLLWWCNGMGSPNLYNLELAFEAGDDVSDNLSLPFGIRKIETYTTPAGHKGFKLNGREVLIRGAGWTDDIFLNNSPERNEIQVQYVKDMNLNTIRFETFWGTNRNIYDLCDRYGLLAMAGWCCQWEWDDYLGKACDDFGGIVTEAEQALMVESLGDQVRYLQYHPSLFVWLVGSDKIPRPALETKYRDLLGKIDDRPYLASASTRMSKVSGPTGMKMRGPYEYVGPSYWYTDTVNGGAYGFNTETGPGPQIPVFETLQKMIPADKMWPLSPVWNIHCNPAKEAFNSLDVFNGVLWQRYGRASDLNNYLLKAEVQQYEALKAMFESFRAGWPKTTGVVQWMLNSAWPSLYWQLYDYYLLPTSAYYAAQQANRPVQVVYDYGRHRLVLVNATLEKHARITARIRMTDMNGKDLLSDEVMVGAEPNAAADIYTLPALSSLAFLKTELVEAGGQVLADNFYWLAPGKDVYDWEKTTWYYTPLKTSVDFKPLSYMGAAHVGINVRSATGSEGSSVDVSLKNPAGPPAFFIHLRITGAAGQTLAPVFWSDNYVSLLPGDNLNLTCKIPPAAESKGLQLVVSGWNVPEQTIKLP
jgi:exo-1,4-beta-D-glucosaminidase